MIKPDQDIRKEMLLGTGQSATKANRVRVDGNAIVLLKCGRCAHLRICCRVLLL